MQRKLIFKGQRGLIAVLSFLLFFCGSLKAENLIADGAFENERPGWGRFTLNGEKASAEDAAWEIDEKDFHEGKKSLKVTNKKEGDCHTSILANSSFKLKGETSYRLRMAYKTKGVAAGKSPAIWVRVAVSGGDGPLVDNYAGLSVRPSGTWTANEKKDKTYITKKEAESAHITIFFYGKGEFWIDDLCMEPETVPEEEKLVVGGKTFFYKPRDIVKDPPLAEVSQRNIWSPVRFLKKIFGKAGKNDRQKGCILYQRNPRMLYADSIPQPEERIKRLKNFAVPGEYAAFYFSLHGLRALKATGLEVSDLTNAKGNGKISGQLFEKKLIKIWAQMTTWGAPFYYIIPELLEDFEATNICEGKNQGFWLQIKVPAGAAAGDYQGKVGLVFESGEKAEIPLALKVLPFALAQPPVEWVMYSVLHIAPQRHYPEEQKVRYLADMKDYGVNGFDQRWGILKESIENFQSLRRKAGMNGPWVINCGSSLERQIITELTGSKDFSSYPYPGTEKPEVKRAFVKALQEADKWIKETGAGGYDNWYYEGVDEPHCGRMEQALWEYPLAKEAGVKTFATVYPYDAVSNMAPYLDVSCNAFIANSKDVLDKYLALGKAKGFAYWYLGAGCYTGQEGGLMPNRWQAGFLFYKTGLPAHVSYTYQETRKHKNPKDLYNDFIDGKYGAITYPSREKSASRVSLSTLQWEGIREGIADYKYAYTLEQKIAEARKKGHAKEAEQSRQLLDKVLGYVPWPGDMYDEKMDLKKDVVIIGNCYALPGTFTNEKADKLRWMLAAEIIRLDGVMK